MTVKLSDPPPHSVVDPRERDNDADDLCHLAISDYTSWCGKHFSEGVTCTGDLVQEGDICSCCGRPFCQPCMMLWRLEGNVR